MMTAARFYGVGELRIEKIPAPQPTPGEVLVRPAVVGVCGTDSHIMAGDYPARPPVTLGHEIAGHVVDLGLGRDSQAGLQIGDLVTIEPHRYCGWCTYCRRGLEHMCVRKLAYGVHVDGGMAELLAVPAAIAYRLPTAITPEIGALTEPLACCVHGMDRLDAKAGLPVIVFGAGPAGALLVALARHAGLHPIVAVDGRADRRDLAVRMGADMTLEPDEDLHAATAELTGGIGFPYLIDAVGSAEVLATCVQLACRAATILVFGVAPSQARLSISPNDIYTRELTIAGTAINPHTHSRAVGLLHRLPLQELSIAQFPLSEAAAAILASEAGKQDKVQVVLGA